VDREGPRCRRKDARHDERRKPVSAALIADIPKAGRQAPRGACRLRVKTVWNKQDGVLLTMASGQAGVGTKNMWLATVLAVTLGACAGSGEPKIEENIYPTNYKSGILDRLRLHVADPVGIRDAYITEPALKPNAGHTRYIVCIRFNAKDDDGRYVGNKEFAAFFFAGRMTQIIDATGELCGDAAYQPFPELQKLCRELACKS